MRTRPALATFIAAAGLATLAATGLIPLAPAQTEAIPASPSNDAHSAATLADLRWIAGDWRGTRPDGSTVEESWREPIGDAMVGTFRSVTPEGRTRFYELMVIEQTDTGPVLRLRHFNPGDGLPCWEEKDQCLTWSLHESKPGRIVFRRDVDGQTGDLLIEQKGDDELHIAVDIFRDNQKRTLAFDLARH